MDEALRKKLNALRAMATGRGASEAEAMAAAEKLAEIMREHGVSDDDIDIEEAQVSIRHKGNSVRAPLISVISICTNTAATIHAGCAPVVIFLGAAPGPEIATYLVQVCDRAIDRAVADFQRGPEYKRRRTVATRRQASQDFTIGMVSRLSGRLQAMFKDGMDKAARDRAIAVRNIRMPALESVPFRDRKVRFGSAAADGYSAGSRVQLAHGVSGGRAPRQIGRV